jgi:hypothetical protein
MKKTEILVILFLVMLVGNLSGQQIAADISEIEKFAAKPDILIEKQYAESGNIDAVEMTTVKYTDLNTDQSILGIRFEYQYDKNVITQTKIAYLDADEIDKLVNALKRMQTSVFNSTREAYTEVSFRSRSGLVFGAYYSPDKKQWAAFIQLNYLDNKTTVFLRTEDFEYYQKLLLDAKVKF